MFELYINDKIIDLPEESEQIGLEYAIMSIEDIGGRTGAKSYEYSVPKTDINLQAIGFNTELPNTSKFPYTRLKARAYEDGVDLNIRFAELTSINETINFRLYGDNANFYSLIKDLKVSDLDLSDLDHFWDDFNIEIGLLKTSGYQYPIIDYSITEPQPNVIESKNLYPSLFYDELLQRFFQYVGYQLINDASGYYSDKLILPFSGTDYIRNSDNRKYLTKVSVTSDYNFFNDLQGETRYVKWDTLLKPTKYFTPLTENWKAQQTTNNKDGRFVEFADRVKISGNVTIKLKNNNYLTIASGYTNQYELIVKTGYGQESKVGYSFAVGEVFKTVSLSFTDLVTSLNFDGLAVCIKSYVTEIQPTIQGVDIISGSFLEITSCEILTPREIVWNPKTELDPDERPSFMEKISNHNQNYITMNSIWGDLSFADLLKNYCLMFGLLPVVDNIRKSVRLFRFDGLRSNINKSKDWTLKIDYTEDSELTFIDENYGQKSLFQWQIDTYKDENDFTQNEEPEGANDTLLIDNKNLESEKTVVELDFAASISVIRFITRNVVWIPMVNETGSRTSKTQRVLFTTLKYDDYNQILVHFTDRPITGKKYTYIPYFSTALHFTELRANHYALLESVILKYKKLKIYLRLNASDINQLDFTAPVYLQQFESYFYISKVEDYKPSTRDSCIVELVKLNING